jgi:endoglucanase
MRSMKAAALVLCAFAPQLYAQADSGGTKPSNWWSERSRPPSPYAQDAKKLPRIQVLGNRFVGEGQRPILFRGFSISDPDKIHDQGQWNKRLFEQVRLTGATLVRIPVHPVAWRERTPDGYLALLDQAVEWATDVGVYLVIDWHSIGNLKTGLFQNRMYDTSLAETLAFWRTVSAHFSGHNTVAFYELFNEPTTWQGRLGPMSWEEWKTINEDLISLIRAHDRDVIPLVAGFDWAYDLTPLRVSPIAAERIGYVTHPYAHKRTPPWEPKWEEDFGFAAARYPIIATEMGYRVRPGSTEGAEYGPAIVSYLEGKGISWLAWVIDPEWGPSLIESWEPFKLTEPGQFFSGAMQGKP